MPEKSEIIIKSLVVGEFMVNTYIVACITSGIGIIIDPAGEVDRIRAEVDNAGLSIKYILNTHGHGDHVIGNHDLKEMFKAEVCIHGIDDDFFQEPQVMAVSQSELGLCGPPPCNIRLNHGDVINAGGLSIQVIHTPGHTPGSVCYKIADNLFTGDTLFVGAAGRTDLIGGSLDILIESIEAQILPLPKETIIWPGHDYGETPTSTLAREMEENVYITDFIL